MKLPAEFSAVDARLRGYQSGRTKERAACAELAKMIPCSCLTLCIDHEWSGKFSGEADTRVADQQDGRHPEGRAA